MATTRTIDRQPDKLDYLSPTQFKFNIHQLPKVEFFTVSAQIPSISMGNAVMPTRLVDLPMMGDKITYDPLTISFICDEFLENYLSLHEWITGIGFPKSTDQFKDFRASTSATPSNLRYTTANVQMSIDGTIGHQCGEIPNPGSNPKHINLSNYLLTLSERPVSQL